MAELVLVATDMKTSRAYVQTARARSSEATRRRIMDALMGLVMERASVSVQLAEVAERAGVSAADVVAFGDMPNDLPMLGWAGHGVAMANAHPDVLAAADEVTAPHGEDGVALVLERWF